MSNDTHRIHVGEHPALAGRGGARNVDDTMATEAERGLVEVLYGIGDVGRLEDPVDVLRGLQRLAFVAAMARHDVERRELRSA
jgi:hypothetical protein